MDDDRNTLQKRWGSLSGRTREILSTLGILVAAIVLALALTRFVIQSYQVDGQSMETTLSNGDRLLVNKLPRTFARITGGDYVPKRGDIIIFNQSGLSFASGQQKQLVKRVIGLPGERVVVKDGKLTVFNNQYPSGFEPDDSGQYSLSSSTTPGNIDAKLSNNEIFVCGDNRNNSEDSRFFGPLKLDNIVGKLVVRVLPLDKAQRF